MVEDYNPVFVGQVLQNVGKATIELQSGKYEAVITRLLPYLTRTDYPEDLRKLVIAIFLDAVGALLCKAKGKEVIE